MDSRLIPNVGTLTLKKIFVLACCALGLGLSVLGCGSGEVSYDAQKAKQDELKKFADTHESAPMPTRDRGE